MLLKVHEIKQKGFTEIVVALCDEKLLGKKIGGNFFINPRFYRGKKTSEEQVLQALSNASIINAVGEDSVNFLIKHDIIKTEHVKKIKNVPHAQIIFLHTK